MLIKLLKYDLKYMIKNMGMFYILTIFFSLLTRILFEIEQTVIIKIISYISLGCLFSLFASIMVNVILRSWIRFRDSLYKDEAYLTHTLPVEKKYLYDSKFVQTLIFFTISFLTIILCLFITFYNKSNWLILTNLINSITTGLKFNTSLFLISMITIIFLEIFNTIQCGFLGIILGYRRNNNKLFLSVIFGFISYLISQTIILSLIFIMGIFNKNIMDLFKNNIMLDTAGFKLLIVLSILLYASIIIIMNMICKKELNKGIDIE